MSNVRPKAILWGKIVHAFIKTGWNPPKPNDQILRAITEDIERLNNTSATIELSSSQLMAIQLAAEGYTEKEAAKIAKVNTDTMKKYKKQACRNLGGKNMVHAVVIALRERIIE